MTNEQKAIYDKLYIIFREQRDEFDLKFEMEEFDYMSNAEWGKMTPQEQSKWLNDKEAERREEESKMDMW